MNKHIGLVVPTNEPGAAESLQTLPQLAEEWGYASLWATDHIVGVRAMEGVYGSYWLEALTSLTWMAARTSTIRLGTGILVLPHRNPVLVAKTVATLDRLSAGRVDLGVGTGWSKTEFLAVGAESLFEPRGRVSNESLDVMLECWLGGPVSHDGEFFTVRHVEFEPTPVQQPHPPIWVGGHSPAAIRRTARFGDVWHPHDLSPSDLASLGAQLDEQAGRAVTRSVRLNLSEDDVEGLRELIDEYLQVGCSRVVLDFRSQPCAEVTRLAESAASELFR